MSQPPLSSARPQKRGRSPTPKQGVRPSAEGSIGFPSRGLPKLQIAGQTDAEMESPAVMPRYVATGTTPPSVGSDNSSDENEMKAAAAASMEQMNIMATLTIAEADEPPVSVAASSGGSDVLPTPRTRTAEAVARMTLGPQQPRPDQGA